jgi:hypothetical protein
MSFVQFKDAFKASKGALSPRSCASRRTRERAPRFARCFSRAAACARARAHSRAAPFVQIT